VTGTQHRRCYFSLAGLITVILSLALGASASAQTIGGELSGSVTDSTGSVIVGARLVIRNTATGSERQAVTNTRGEFHIPSLPPGEYQIEAEAPGFSKSIRTVSVKVGEKVILNVVLAVAGVREEVLVEGVSGPAVQRQSAELGGVVERRQILELPLNGRSFEQLALLEPGVISTTNRVSGLNTHGLQINVNGAGSRSNSFLLDGTTVTDAFNAGVGSLANTFLGVDAVREFRVLTNAYSAEYGKAAGGIVSIVTKSGTNAFHGTAFEYLRNDNLDARNFFDPVKQPEFKRNQFGFSASGPIVRDRTFFFGTAEWLRERLGRTVVTVVPSLDARQGRLPDPANPGRFITVTINPAVLPFLNLFPLPNGRDFGTGLAEFSFPFSQNTDETFVQARVDHSLSPKNNFFVRYTVDDATKIEPLDYPIVAIGSQSRNQYLTVEDTHVLSSSWVNTFRFSYARTNISQIDVPQILLSPDILFIPERNAFGLISIGGMPPFGGSRFRQQGQLQNLYSWSDDMVLTKGSHSLKWGVLIERQQNKALAENFFAGGYDFAGIQQFLEGRPSRFTAASLDSEPVRYYFTNLFGVYVQDDLRLTRRLTLNLGLRLELASVPKEKFGRTVALPDILRASQVTVGPPFENQKQNWAPRIGFAWDPWGDGKTALRGGFGIFYDINPIPYFIAFNIVNPPFFRFLIVRNPSFPRQSLATGVAALSVFPNDFNWQTPHTLQYNVALERELRKDTVLTVAYVGSRGINVVRGGDVNAPIPMTLPDGRAFFPAGARPRNPNFGSIDLKRPDGNSWHNALQLRVRSQLGRDVHLQGSYTFARTIDEAQGLISFDALGSVPQVHNPDDRRYERGLTDFHRKHTLVINSLWDLPFFRGAKGVVGALLGHWGVRGIVTVQSGNPFTVGIQSDWVRNLNRRPGIARPNVKPGFTTERIILGKPDRYFDPNAFELQEPGTYGNLGRNSLIGPGLATVDWALVKYFPVRALGEEGHLQLRFEFFNLFNRANFGLPQRIVFAGVRRDEPPLGSAGRITSTTTSARQIQIALRLSW